ncbi:hypothetical protein JZ751_023462 [Albula glossodonta]|uniref:Ankyrin repeat domain-containing protein n=1 Tax=Albula glossodonta TaxID=121402 RepID=A0A8T2NKM8_9TELE|nr:hypothetical protein JZ751_023462 [Albula glossodonta]
MCSAANEDFMVKFPLHYLVWENDYRKLEKELKKNNIETVDPRGRTPLHLAVSLGHLESVRVLLRHNAEVTKENAKGWTASTALGGVPELLCKIRESPDFYMEMKWEFTSWIPLVSRVCPSDVCRIWKSGANIRVDATLLGFENMTWIRGRRSYIFRGDDSMQPAEQEVAKRLTTPIVNTYLDTHHIAFERNKSGIWGWRTEKTEVVNGFEAKVFTVNNVNVVIRTRTEHLTDEEKARIKDERNVLESLLGTVEQHFSAQGDLTMEYATATNPTAITPEEYFNPDFDLKDRDIGRPIELTIRTQKFKATLWMSEEHPLSLVEQVTPIIDLMARTSTHFARLRDFVALKFPPGFPVKIEIPLFHVLNARITFGNVNKCSTGEPPEATPTTASATPTEEGGECTALAPFQVCPTVFEVPAHYRHRGGSRTMPMSNHDEELLQYAIHQRHSTVYAVKCAEVAWVDNNGMLSESVVNSPGERSAPEGVLVDLGDTVSPASSGSTSSPDSDLRLAMALSTQAQEEEARRQREEEEELQRILQLSLTEK